MPYRPQPVGMVKTAAPPRTSKTPRTPKTPNTPKAKKSRTGARGSSSAETPSPHEQGSAGAARGLAHPTLLRMAERGDCSSIVALLQSRCAVDSQDSEGRTALFFAAEHGHAAMVQLLHDRKANVDHRDVLGRTPLFVSAPGDAMRRLLSARCDAAAVDICKRSALFWAVHAGNEASLSQLLDHTGPGALRAEDIFGRNAFAYVSSSAQEADFEDTLARLSKIHAEDPALQAIAARSRAASSGQVGGGVSPQALDGSGAARASSAAGLWPGTRTSVDFVCALYLAVENGLYAEEHCKNVVEAASPPEGTLGNIRDPMTLETPLHRAVKYGDVACVEYLIGAACDPNAQDVAGRTPLYLAVSLGYVGAIATLLAGGGDVNVGKQFCPRSVAALCEVAPFLLDWRGPPAPTAEPREKLFALKDVTDIENEAKLKAKAITDLATAEREGENTSGLDVQSPREPEQLTPEKQLGAKTPPETQRTMPGKQHYRIVFHEPVKDGCRTGRPLQRDSDEFAAAMMRAQELFPSLRLGLRPI